MANEVTIRVTAKDEASKTFASVQKSAGGLGKAMGDVAKIAGGFVLGAGLLKLPGLLSGGVSAASDLSESMSKVNVVFGEQAKEIQDWARTAASAFGQSRQQALEAAGTYGNLFQAFGVGRDEAAKMSTSLVELAADLASFNNTSVDDALLALRSGLSGETEPLKRFGVAINDARLKDEALRLGLIKTTKEALTPGAKAQAAYALIMKDTALAQGDFARTSDGLANKQRILSARFKDLQADIGTALIPVMLALGDVALGKVVPAFEEISGRVGPALRDIFREIKEQVDGLLQAVEPLASMFRAGLGGSTVGGEFSALEEAAFGIGQVLRNNIIPAFNDLKRGVELFVLALRGGDAGGNLTSLQQKFLQLGKDVRTSWEGEIKPALQAFAAIVEEVVRVVVENWGSIEPVLRFIAEDMLTRIEGMVQALHGFVEVISGIVQAIDDLIHGRWAQVWDDMKLIAAGAIDLLIGAIKTMLGKLPETMFNLGKDAAQSFVKGLGESGVAGISVNDVIGAVGKVIPGRAHGGPGGGLTRVGERGMELVRLPGGSHVYSHEDSMRMLGQGGGGEIVVNLNNAVIYARDRDDAERALGDVGWAIRARAKGLAG